jgi:hypothetical protein
MTMPKPRLLSQPAGVRYDALRRLFLMIRTDRPHFWRELVDAVRHADKPEEAAAAWLEQKGLMDDGRVALPAACAVLLNDVQDWRLIAVVLHFMNEGFLPSGEHFQFVYTLDLMQLDVRQFPPNIEGLIAWATDDFTAQLRAWLQQCGLVQEVPKDTDVRLQALLLHLVDNKSVTAIAHRNNEIHDVSAARRLLRQAEELTGLKRRTRPGRPSIK